MCSRRPGELRPRERGLALVGDPEGIDVGPRHVRDGELRPRRVEDAGQDGRLARLDAEGHDVLDLEVDLVADPDRVRQPVLANLDRGALDPEVLADQRTEGLHRTAERAREDATELLRLL